MTIQANQGPGVSIFGATSAGGGGSTSPGGSSGQVQYNSGGSFGGMAGTSWDDTNRALTLTGATVTTSQPVLNLSQTWNAGAVTFTGLKFNATDTASAAASLLLDLQVGTVSQFNLSKSGVATFAVGSKTAPTVKFSGLNGGFYGRETGNISVTNGAVEIGLITGNGTSFLNRIGIAIGAGSGGDLSTTAADLLLTRAAAATLQLGAADAAAPVAQTLQVQGVVAGTSNTAGTNWTLKGSAGTGTGAGGSIIFQVAPAGSSGTAQNAYATALTIQGDRAAFFTNYATFASATIGLGYIGNNIVTVGANGSYSFGNANNNLNNPDVFLARDAANTLALRNSTNAQTFNVYNTYTDASNYERLSISWASNICTLSTSGAGTGATNRRLDITSGGQLNLSATQGSILTIATNGTIRWYFDGANGHLLANADNTYDIGASGANRPRNLFVANNATFGGLPLAAGGTIRLANSDGDITLAGGVIYIPAATRFGIGGSTSSFPALKRVSANFQVIAADNSGSAGFIVGNQALATTATDGFLYVPTCAGTPTGTPTTQTGTAPIVVDTTNNKLYFYSGGQWRDAGP